MLLTIKTGKNSETCPIVTPEAKHEKKNETLGVRLPEAVQSALPMVPPREMYRPPSQLKADAP